MPTSIRTRSEGCSRFPLPEAAPKPFAGGGSTTENGLSSRGLPLRSMTPACRNHFDKIVRLIPAAAAAVSVDVPANTSLITRARNEAGNISNSLFRSRTHHLKRPDARDIIRPLGGRPTPSGR
ncbi:hypothetical protein GCM10011512_21590 [Tersicoccus solisilvae]|uniref:Uncharacterized protein n=1 Tax=Tersicoccus solisilvae TaxID=1882339 RepID=A0ABQ1PBX9_9MICC|nr:hypothetical protein GCM10011512_21590 [Tersicoccus solisilvae]